MGIWNRLRRRRRSTAAQPVRKGTPPPTMADWLSSAPDLKDWTHGITHPRFDPGAELGGRAIGPHLTEFDDLLHPGFLELLLREIDAFTAWRDEVGAQIEPPNSMHEGGFVLEPLGLAAAMDAIAREVLTPLAGRLFPAHAFGPLTEAHAFIAEYGGYGDQDLGFHVDDSEVTLTLCLGGDFIGSDIYFSGVRCADHRQDVEIKAERTVYSPSPGKGLVHLGAHRHGVLPIESGERRSLIVWARDPSLNEERAFGTGRCPSWCESSSFP